MGRFMDEISKFNQNVTSPDGNILLNLSGNSAMTIMFRDDTFEEYHVDELEGQLVHLFQRGWAVRRSARNRALTKAVGHKVRDRIPYSSQERIFREERSKLSGIGETDNIEVIFSVDEAEWEINISDNAMEDLDQDEFIQELQQASEAAISDIREQIINLKDHIYHGHPLREID